jgi:hypothetical protein
MAESDSSGTASRLPGCFSPEMVSAYPGSDVETLREASPGKALIATQCNQRVYSCSWRLQLS